MTPGQILAVCLASLTSAPLIVLAPQLAPDDAPAALGVPDARQPVPGVDTRTWLEPSRASWMAWTVAPTYPKPGP